MSRRAAYLVWGSMVVVPFFFLAVADTARWAPTGPGSSALLFWLTVAVSFLNVVLSRALPPRLGPFHSGAEATTFTRMVIGWALCDAAALFPLVAWIVSGDPRLIGVFAVDVLALVLLMPSDQRWASLRPAHPPSDVRRNP